MNKKDRLKELILDLHKGVDEAKVKEEFKKEFSNVSSFEISQLEQNLIQEGMPISEVQRLCNVHADVFEGSIEDIHVLDSIDSKMGHPLFVFRKENQGLREYINNDFMPLVKAYKKDPTDENRKNLLASLNYLKKVTIHYERKENLLFPYLEQNNITGPTQVMWGKDDEVRDLFRQLRDESLDKDQILAKIVSLITEIESMIKKEEDILSPLLVKNIKDYEWVQIAKDSRDFTYVFNDGIEGASTSDANTWLLNNSDITKANDPKNDVDTKEDFIDQDSAIKLPSGMFKIEELTSMLNSMPMETTFIDKDDKVKFFSEGSNQIFKRVRSIIGRDVRNCHPPKALPVVEKLLEDFKAGRKDLEIRFAPMGEKLVLVRYAAVRDNEGNYLGTVETVEEISSIIKMAEEFKR